MGKLAELLRGAPAPVSATTPVPLSPTPAARSLWAARGDGVQDSEDLRRILALPSRPPAPTPEEGEALVEEMIRRFRRPGSNERPRVIQAFALKEAESAGGLLGLIGVGQGKSLLSLLLFTLWKSRVGILMVPAALLPKVKADYERWVPHFYLPRLQGSDVAMGDETGVVYAVSYSSLSAKSGADLLDRIPADAMVLDEGHSVAGLARSSRRDRFRAGVKKGAKSGRLKHLGILSGTLITRSIKPAAGLGKMIFGVGSPLPLDYHELEAWSYALDPAPNPAPPGALAKFCEGDETPREGFRRRLLSTPGIVGTSKDVVEAGLEFYRRDIQVPPEVTAALETLRKSWKTPTGHSFDLALEFSRYARQLATGLELHWTFPRGEPEDLRDYWFEVRSSWNKEVQDYLNHRSRPGMDSEGLLEDAAESGTWKSETWAEWKAVKDRVRPHTEVHWVSDFLVKDAAAWGLEAPGIIWTANTSLGEAIAKSGDFPWFGAGEEASKALLVEAARKKPRTIVASMDAHSTGNDLQLWNRQLFTYTSSNSKRHEQAIARSHRPGQLSDVVSVYYYTHTIETQKALAAARVNARGVSELTGQSQKLLDGTWVSEAFRKL